MAQLTDLLLYRHCRQPFGYSSSMELSTLRLSQIVVVVWSASVADMIEGAPMGSEPRPKEMLQTRLQFGILGTESYGNEGIEVRQIVFGLVAHVKSPVKVIHYV